MKEPANHQKVGSLANSNKQLANLHEPTKPNPRPKHQVLVFRGYSMVRGRNTPLARHSLRRKAALRRAMQQQGPQLMSVRGSKPPKHRRYLSKQQRVLHGRLRTPSCDFPFCAGRQLRRPPFSGYAPSERRQGHESQLFKAKLRRTPQRLLSGQGVLDIAEKGVSGEWPRLQNRAMPLERHREDTPPRLPQAIKAPSKGYTQGLRKARVGTRQDQPSSQLLKKHE